MGLNWLDLVLIVIFLVTLVLGIIKGLVRQVIGIAAAVGGIILGSLYYPGIADILQKIIRNRLVCNFLGFMIILAAALAAGWLLGLLVSKLIKGPLAFLNHVLGGVLGIVKGVLIGGALIFALLVFDLGKQGLAKSRLAPLFYQTTRAVVLLIPGDLRMKFKASYEAIRQGGEIHGEKI